MGDHAIEVLLVEDNPDDEALTLHALRKHGLANAIRVARDGAEALEVVFDEGSGALKSRPRVILLDLKLPKVDGIEVLRRLKEDPRTHAIPVVVMTSSHEERDIVDSYRLGVNSYIVKPLDFDQFSEAVRQLGFYWLVVNQPPLG